MVATVLVSSVYMIYALLKSGCLKDWPKQSELFKHPIFYSDPVCKSSIYFATGFGGLKAYSMETLQTSTIVNSSEELYGVAYDSVARKVYFSSNTKIYRANMDGTNQETVLSTTQCKSTQHMFQSCTSTLTLTTLFLTILQTGKCNALHLTP